MDHVGQGEVDDPIGAAERNRGLGAGLGEGVQTGTRTTAEDDAEDVLQYERDG